MVVVWEESGGGGGGGRKSENEGGVGGRNKERQQNITPRLPSLNCSAYVCRGEGGGTYLARCAVGWIGLDDTDHCCVHYRYLLTCMYVLPDWTESRLG